MRKLENQKEIIFNTAKDLLVNGDVNKFSIRMISTRCNIGMGTIYKYYGGKDDIILDITRDLWMSYLQEVKSYNFEFTDFFEYVQYLFEKLNEYSVKFNYTVLSKELSNTFRIEGKQEHHKAFRLYISLIMDKLSIFYYVEEKKSLIIADFIAHNLVSMITNKEYKFDVFKNILIDLLSNYKEKK